MLSGEQLKDFRTRRNISLRDIEAYAIPPITAQMVGMIERGERNVTEENHKSIVTGINRAYFAKTNGTFHREPIQKSKPKSEEVEPSPTTTEQPKVDEPAKEKKPTRKSNSRKDK